MNGRTGLLFRPHVSPATWPFRPSSPLSHSKQKEIKLCLAVNGNLRFYTGAGAEMETRGCGAGWQHPPFRRSGRLPVGRRMPFCLTTLPDHESIIYKHFWRSFRLGTIGSGSQSPSFPVTYRSPSSSPSPSRATSQPVSSPVSPGPAKRANRSLRSTIRRL